MRRDADAARLLYEPRGEPSRRRVLQQLVVAELGAATRRRRKRPPPLLEAAAKILGIHLEHVTDVLEREQPRAIVRYEPFLSFEEAGLLSGILCQRILTVTVDRVFQDRQHQPPFTLNRAALPKRRKILTWQENIWLEQAPAAAAFRLLRPCLHRTSF